MILVIWLLLFFFGACSPTAWLSIASLRVSGDASIWCLSDRFRVVATGYVDELIVSSMMYACV